jgi:hypothetical protein
VAGEVRDDVEIDDLVRMVQAVAPVRQRGVRLRQNGDVIAETPAQVQDLRARYVASLDTLHEASGQLASVLRETDAGCAVARELVSSGRPLGDVEELMEPLSLRSSLSDALAELERARHSAQRLLFLLLQSEGKSLADIGRTYGISRQLVSRLVNEAEPARGLTNP